MHKITSNTLHTFLCRFDVIKLAKLSGLTIDIIYYYVIWTDKRVCYLKPTLRGKRGNIYQ